MFKITGKAGGTLGLGLLAACTVAPAYDQVRHGHLDDIATPQFLKQLSQVHLPGCLFGSYRKIQRILLWQVLIRLIESYCTDMSQTVLDKLHTSA